MRFSLIVATRGRSVELAELFASLVAQQPFAPEVIIVDQNPDDRLSPVIESFAGRLAVRRARSAIANANHARNLGLRLARGDLVGFPDDDCALKPGVLAQVDAAFAADPAAAGGLGVLTGPAEAPDGSLGSGRWRAEAGPITPANVWTSVIEFNLWLPRTLALSLGGFDESLGPGTRFGSAEGNDLVLRALAAGHTARYDPNLRLLHPDKQLTRVAADRARVYGMGLGRVMRRHAVPPAVWLPYLIRPTGGMLLSLLRGRGLAARYYAMSLAGRLAGFRAPGAAAGRALVPLTPDTAPIPSSAQLARAP